MTSDELRYYINSRYGQLSSDELLEVLDTSKNPTLNHIVYENGCWKAWDKDGNYFEFTKKRLVDKEKKK